jgi:hypothetical protein
MQERVTMQERVLPILLLETQALSDRVGRRHLSLLSHPSNAGGQGIMEQTAD